MTPLERLTIALADRYRVERELGAGGMATVYLAHDLKHEREVAIKVLSPELGAVLGAERFLSEIRTTANLQHPHLLPLFDSGEADGLLFYVMPFVDGETLRARLEREKQLPVEEALRLAGAVATALEYAHARGVIHRDLKPENILLQAGQPVVADFGIALAVRNAGGARVTQTGLSLGTPQYMSPEQAMGDRALDARTDQYSLGAVVYEMLAGEPPHSATTGQAVIARLLTEPPRQLREARSSVPVPVARAVHRALEKLPADRWPSVAEFAAAIRAPSTGFDNEAGSTPASKGTRSWLTTVFGVAAGVFALVAGWALQRPTPTIPTTRYVVAMDSTERLGGSGTRIAMSLDGATLVYTNGRDSKIWVRRRESLQGTPLEGTEGAYSPFFSPDGQSVGYVDSERRLRLVTLDGARMTKVTDSLVGLAGSAWSKAGMIYGDAAGSTGLVQVEAQAGAHPRRFTTTDTSAGEVNHAWPEMLPDGEALLFQIRYTAADGELSHAIGIADVATGKHRKLCDGVFARVIDDDRILVVDEQGEVSVVPFDARRKQVNGSPTMLGITVYLQSSRGADIAVSKNGRLAYVEGTGSTTFELLWLDAAGRKARVDTAWHGDFAAPRVSRDGSRLAVTKFSKGRADVWIKPLPNGTPYRLTLDATLNTAPTWGPDAASVTYITRSNPNAPTEVRVKQADGSTRERTVPLPRGHHAAEVDWSPDGKWLVYRTVDFQAKNKGFYTDIYAFRPGVDTAPRAIESKLARRVSPALSPDGRYLAYVSSESGRGEVFVVPFPDVTRTRWLAGVAGVGGDIRWTPDGRFLLWRAAGNRIQKTEVRLGEDFAVLKQDFWDGNAGISGTFLGSSRVFDAAPNGQLLVAQGIEDDGTAKLIVVENWLAELNKRAGAKR